MIHLSTRPDVAWPRSSCDTLRWPLRTLLLWTTLTVTVATVVRSFPGFSRPVPTLGERMRAHELRELLPVGFCQKVGINGCGIINSLWKPIPLYDDLQ